MHYGVHGEIYIGMDSRLIDLSLCCIICCQIKKNWLPNQNYWYLVSRTSGNPPCSPRDSTLWLENRPKWADNLTGRTVRSTTRQRVAVRAHEKSRGQGDFVKSALRGLYISPTDWPHDLTSLYSHHNFISWGVYTVINSHN